jgi:large subunit ribosomal protein L23
MESVIIRPVVTEKSARALMENNQYIVLVHPDANKIQVRNDFQTKYGVKVDSVNLVKVAAKVRRRGKLVGKSRQKLKAVVFVQKGQVVEEIKKLF